MGYVEVRRREAQQLSAAITLDDDARDLERTPEEACNVPKIAGSDELANLVRHPRPIRASASPGARARASAGKRSNTCTGGSIRSESASSTDNGPISSRRNVRQWPPSAAAIARTYVPELTRRSSVATPSLYATTSSASTCERRMGIATSTPRRAR